MGKVYEKAARRYRRMCLKKRIYKHEQTIEKNEQRFTDEQKTMDEDQERIKALGGTNEMKE